MFSSLDAYRLAGDVPDGIAPGSDKATLAVGTLTGLDGPAGLAQVSVAGAEAVWVPALPAIYPAGGTVLLLRSPLDGGRIALCLGPMTAADLIVAGQVTAIDTTNGTVTVTVLGQSYTLPFNAGTYAVNTLVHVLRDPQQFGRPVFVLGPQGNFSGAAPETPGGGQGNTGQLVNREAVIVPQWSGSWRNGYGWNRWNTDRYGGRSTLWQNALGSSGFLTGLAAYGDQIVSLGAEAITRMTVNVYRADSSYSDPRAAVLQPSPHGAQPAGAPVVSPAEFVTSAGVRPGEGTQVVLPGSVYDGFRTGAFKGIATVGSVYAGFSGTPNLAPVHADGMALTIQYQVRA